MLNHPAKYDGPETSHLAADYIVSSGVQGDQQALAVATVRAYPGMTSFELAMLSNHDRFMLARRLPECAAPEESSPRYGMEPGRTYLICRGPARTCSVTGRKATTWHPEPVQMELRMGAA